MVDIGTLVDNVLNLVYNPETGDVTPYFSVAVLTAALAAGGLYVTCKKIKDRFKRQDNRIEYNQGR